MNDKKTEALVDIMAKQNKLILSTRERLIILEQKNRALTIFTVVLSFCLIIGLGVISG
jgi:hypothetical protein|tara:strand:- start:1324 stop:1497 length:174 start_codon:yes stop_codon:yes gene_type:complete